MSVRCGNHPRGSKTNHPTTEDVRDCYAGRYHEEDEAKAEQEMEARQERWYEERGGGEPEDPREVHAQMMDDMRREEAEADRPTDLIAALEQSVREKRFIEEEEAERAGALLDGMTGTHGRDMASAAQIDYAMDLLAGRKWPDSLTRHDVENMERRQVSKLIDQLKRAPIKANAAKSVLSADDYKNVPTARYALDENNDGGVRFFEVTLPTKPMWKGRIFIAELFGAPGDYRKEPRRGAKGKFLLDQIARDPDAAMTLFGLKTETCGKCHSPLTDKKSRERGIGPVCIKKLGW